MWRCLCHGIIYLSATIAHGNRPPLLPDQCDVRPTKEQERESKYKQWLSTIRNDERFDVSVEKSNHFDLKPNFNDTSCHIWHQVPQYYLTARRHISLDLPFFNTQNVAKFLFLFGDRWSLLKYDDGNLFVLRPAGNPQPKLLQIGLTNHMPNTNKHPSCTLYCPEYSMEWPEWNGITKAAKINIG